MKWSFGVSPELFDAAMRGDIAQMKSALENGGGLPNISLPNAFRCVRKDIEEEEEEDCEAGSTSLTSAAKVYFFCRFFFL